MLYDLLRNLIVGAGLTFFREGWVDNKDIKGHML